jgi:hypothetical protein
MSPEPARSESVQLGGARMRTLIFALAATIFAACTIDWARAAGEVRLPGFDITRNCKAEAAAPGAGIESCTRDENQAKDQLGKSWSRFSASQKRACIGMSSIGGDQSYVELLTCLEMSTGGHFSASNEAQQQPPNAPESGSAAGHGPVWKRRH